MLSVNLAMSMIRSKSKGVLSHFISLASTVGIALGVCALIVGLSAMNGFEYELENRVLSVIPQVQLRSDRPEGFADPALQSTLLKEDKNILGAAPSVALNIIVHNQKDFLPVSLSGVDPQINEVIGLDRFLTVKIADLCAASDELLSADRAKLLQTQGSLPPLPMILGRQAAMILGLEQGDEFGAIIIDREDPQNDSLTRAMTHLNSVKFYVLGTLNLGGQLDSMIALTSPQIALTISNLQRPNIINIKTADFLNCLPLVYQAGSKMTEQAYITSWMSSQGKLYHDIQMVRSIMYLAMILVMAVACFNIIGTLFMQAAERKSEIAIMMTLGLKRSSVMKIFTLVGLIKGLQGALIGLVLGVIAALNLTSITSFVESLMGTSFLNENIYFISFIPSRLMLSDILLVTATAVVMAALASLYPAYKASKLDPAALLNS